MIYGKLWCVVKPSVGIPLFLSAVAIASFAVHTALVLNTTWIKDFHQGKAKVVAKAEAPAAAVATADAAKK
jgi:light-harvesting protein B-800-850 alpha chain